MLTTLQHGQTQKHWDPPAQYYDLGCLHIYMPTHKIPVHKQTKKSSITSQFEACELFQWNDTMILFPVDVSQPLLYAGSVYFTGITA